MAKTIKKDPSTEHIIVPGMGAFYKRVDGKLERVSDVNSSVSSDPFEIVRAKREAALKKTKSAKKGGA